MRAVIAFLFGFVVTMFILVQLSHASAVRRIVFDQNGDCPLISGWELAYEPTATAGATPSAAALGASFANTTPLVCGAGITVTQMVTGVGMTRFWLRAVAPGNVKSDWSNTIDTTVPFVLPVLKTVS